MKSHTMGTEKKSLRIVDRSTIAQGLFSLHMDLKNEKVNKFSTCFMEEFDELVSQLALRSDIKAMVVFSDKEGIFIAGADIELIKTVAKAEEGTRLAKMGQEVIQKWEELPFVKIAAINGACLGGGAEFSLCCDYLVASDDPSVRIGLPEVNLGVLPGMGGTYRLPRKIGLQNSLDLILSGKQLNGERAWKIGLVDAVLPVQNFESDTLSIATSLMKKEVPRQYRRIQDPTFAMFTKNVLEKNPIGRAVLFSQARKMVLTKTKGHYPAPLKILDVMQFSAGKSQRLALDCEQKSFGELAATKVCKNLIELFYAMEGVKKLSGVDGTELSKDNCVKSVGLLGAGVMGGGIAQLLAQKNIPVRMKDIDHKGLSMGLASAQKIFASMVKKRRLNKRQSWQKMNLISPTTDYSGFSDLDLIIEAVVENMDVKKKVLKEVESVSGENTLFATNTSSLSVSELAAASLRPKNVVGMHFFNPVHKMPLIEVIRGNQTSDEAVMKIFELSKRLGKTPVVVKDGPGFLVNRLLMPFLNEGSYIMSEGSDIERLDNLTTEWGMPMGPATLLDEIGIDVAVKVGKILHDAFGERAAPCGLNQKLMDAKLYGKKINKGFYLYDEKGKREKLNPEIYSILGVNRKEFSELEMKLWVDRMVLPMINEAAMCLDEAIVRGPSELDLAMIMGTGFPPFRGGLLQYADDRGLQNIVEALNLLAGRFGNRFKPSASLLKFAQGKGKFY